MSPDAESRSGQLKGALRLEMGLLLSGLDSEARAAASAAIAERLTNSEQWSTARVVAAFVGVGLEVDTLPIIECAQREGKRLLLPRCLSSTTLEFAEYRTCDVLESGRFGIPEPMADRPGESLHGIDLVLVPGLAFDCFGGRLGKGAGYYDRAFAPMEKQALPVLLGLGFALQVTQRVPMTTLDISLDAVLTETAWIKTRTFPT